MENLIKVMNLMNEDEIKMLTVTIDAWGLTEDNLNTIASVNPDNTRLDGRGDNITKKIRITEETSLITKQQIFTFFTKIYVCKQKNKKMGLQVEYVLLNNKNEIYTKDSKVNPIDLFYSIESRECL